MMLIGYLITSFFKRRIFPGFKINRKALVVDIGSGDKPFWRADIFFDNLSISNKHRSSNSEITTKIGAFINGDLLASKFKDKVFDFSYCSNVLEHLERPDLAIKEIIRISKRGYLEVPNGLLEAAMPNNGHLWFIYLKDKKLIFCRKSKKIHNILYENGLKFFPYFRLYRPFIQLYWEKNIDFQIINDLSVTDQFFYKSESKNTYQRKQNIAPYLMLLKLTRKLYGLNNKKLPDLFKERNNT